MSARASLDEALAAGPPEPSSIAGAEAAAPAAGEPLPPLGLAASLWALARSLRPKQIIKNLLIFTPAIFSARVSRTWIFDGGVLLRLTTTFVLFSLMVGCTYIVNDWFDRDVDRAHPDKRHRALAAGRLSPALALGFAGAGIALALGLQLGLRDRVVGVAFAGYLVTTLAYSLVLKRLVILDIMTIATLFMLRPFLGALDIGVPGSMWFSSCVGSGALLIATSKRLHEHRLMTRAHGPVAVRAVVHEYSESLLFMLLAVSTIGALLTYCLFALDEAPRALALTIPIVIYGVFRFLYLVLNCDIGGAPEQALLRDRPLLTTVSLWTVCALAIYYRLGAAHGLGGH